MSNLNYQTSTRVLATISGRLDTKQTQPQTLAKRFDVDSSDDNIFST
ncbi:MULTISPECIES: hypothetical protein [Nostoc]|uniref:Uncharacterized protein n=1 Tax=Nostoc paludosum FACHB-159 TaxID=2692908 RepID=A0ABR8KBU7_9NOSO|nr:MULTISPECIES: hypothetical protein [Nostoc]MBD2680756.1 hypothetical protein [Nostoc sp. FACHB-857]MBD2736510.1 hypothetical protein [Nostoc paludosum FACHB-159]